MLNQRHCGTVVQPSSTECQQQPRNRQREWRERNADKERERYRLRDKLNPERDRLRKHRRRARIHGNGFEKYTEAQVIALRGTNCALCSLPIDMTAPRTCKKPGWEQGLHIDHILPISKGGADTLENVQPTHGICNVRKGARA